MHHSITSKESKEMVLCYKLSHSWEYFWNLTRVRQAKLPFTSHKNQETCCVSYLTFLLLSHFFLFNSYLDALTVHSFFMDLVSILSCRFNCSQSVIFKISLLLTFLAAYLPFRALSFCQYFYPTVSLSHHWASTRSPTASTILLPTPG